MKKRPREFNHLKAAKGLARAKHKAKPHKCSLVQTMFNEVSYVSRLLLHPRWHIYLRSFA